MHNIDAGPGLFSALKENYSSEGRRTLIELYLPFVQRLAEKYAYRIEKQPDDYIGTAQLALVESVDNSFRYMKHNEITKYIVVHVRSAMRKFYVEDKAVYIPRKTQDYLFRLGHLVTTTIHPLEASDIAIIDDDMLLQSLIELLPLREQRQVLMLKLAAHTDREISILLDKDIKEIRAIKKVIKERLNDLLGEE